MAIMPETSYLNGMCEILDLNIFYLPNNVSVDMAREKWREQEQLANPRYSVSYVDDKTKVVKTAEQSLKDLLSKLDRSCTLVLWDISQIDFSIDDFSSILLGHAHKSISVRLLSPNYILDPDTSDCKSVLELMASVQKINPPQADTGAGISFIGQNGLSGETIKGLREGKYLGKTLRELSIEFGVSVPTICKYTKGIVPITQETKKDVTRRNEDTFKYSQLENIKIRKNSRLYRIVYEFIKSQRAFQTKRNYYLDLQKFFNYTKADIGLLSEPEEVTFDMGTGYLQYLIDAEFKNTVIRRYFQTLKIFLNYCVKRNYLTTNQVETIKLPLVERHAVKTENLEESELKAILARALNEIEAKKRADSKMIAHRNFVGLYLLATVGMRIGALLSIRLRDIKTVYGQTKITLEAKAGDTYTIPINEAAAKILENYLSIYYQEADADDFIMFYKPDVKSRAMRSGALNMAIKKIVGSTGIDSSKKITGHSFRTTYATMSYNAGMRVEEIQKRLNHKNVNQTIAYLKWAIEKDNTEWMPDLGEALEQYKGGAL